MKQKVQWAKVDTEIYTAAVEKSISDIDTDIDNLCGLDSAVKKVNNVLSEAAVLAAPKGKKPRRRTSKLKVWTPDILKAVEAKKRGLLLVEASRKTE